MANPRHFSGENTIFRGPPGTEDQIGQLPVHRTQSEVISCWALSDEEKAEIARTGIVWLSVYGRKIPPVKVSGTALLYARDADGTPVDYDVDHDLSSSIEVATHNEWISRFVSAIAERLERSGQHLTQPVLDKIVEHGEAAFAVRNVEMSPEAVAAGEFEHIFKPQDEASGT